MNVWGITDIGAVRTQNQDSYRIQTPSDSGCAYGVVCDGMGGARAGNIASAMAVEAFSAALDAALTNGVPEHVPELLAAAAREANRLIFERSTNDEACSGMGTTLVAALVLPDCVHLVNAGDSRAYFVDGEGIAKVTRDHSVVEDLLEQGKITAEQARIHPQKNLITRSLGAESDIKADLYRLLYKPGDLLLLCSDGLSNVLTDQELLFEILHGGAPQDCCRRLLDVALSRGAPDNVTAVLFEL